MHRTLLLAGLTALILGCSSEKKDEETGPCNGEERPCSCQALDEGWCIEYLPPEHEDAPGSLPTEDCTELGGEEVLDACPADNRAGACAQGDDCYQPEYIFYEEYAGTFQGYATLEDVETACDAGAIVKGECERWVPAP